MTNDCLCPPCDNVATEGELCLYCAESDCDPGEARHA